MVPPIGYKHTEEAKKKISEFFRKNPTKYWFGKKGPRNGVKLSDEIKNKLSLSHKGKKHSKDWKINQSKSQTKRWDRVGRKKYKRYIHTRDKKFLQWRSDVFKRDNWTCQTCGIRGVYLEAHHIKSWAKYTESRYELENGVSLCKKCHELTDNFKNK